MDNPPFCKQALLQIPLQLEFDLFRFLGAFVLDADAGVRGNIDALAGNLDREFIPRLDGLCQAP